jgi:hypothetical protein
MGGLYSQPCGPCRCRAGSGATSGPERDQR